MTVTESGLILPPAGFSDDEELGEWLHLCKVRALKAGDELGDDAAYVFAVLRRYAEGVGLGTRAARATARSISLPIDRAADHFERAAAHLKVANNRLDAYVEAVTPPERYRGEFKVKGH